MSPTIRSVVVPVTDLAAAKAIYTALYGAPHTDQPYYVGYAADGFEISLAPQGDVAGGPVAYADVDDLDATRPRCSRPVRPSAARRGRSPPAPGCASWRTPTATRWACAASKDLDVIEKTYVDMTLPWVVIW
ncbi:VOC family protein [Dactylosporangium cerinum]